jgi:hypothetical protein
MLTTAPLAGKGPGSAGEGVGRTGSSTPSQRLLAILDAYDRLLHGYADPVRTSSRAKAFFDLGQSKYILGPANVGRFQYDLRMKAKRLLLPGGGGGGEDVLVTRTCYREEEGVALDLDLELELKEGEGRAEAELEHPEHPPPTRRRRQPHADPAPDPTRDSRSALHPAQQPTEARALADPIRWFSFLPPQSLRHAQAHFIHLLEGYVVLAAQKRALLVMLEGFERDAAPPPGVSG